MQRRVTSSAFVGEGGERGIVAEFEELFLDVSVHWANKELQVEGTKELVFYLLSSLSSHSSSKFCIIIWSIWNDLEVSPHISISLAMQFLADWQHARAKSNTTPSSTTNQNSVQWHKPPTGQIKCNMDATIFSHDTRFGVGLCLRDETGRIIRAKTSWHPWTKEFNISNVIFESDCKNVEDVNHAAHSLVRTSRFYVCSVFHRIIHCISSLIINEMT
ncbi:hypothetical protein GmHk_13G039538 [Glycine max]|nr:hypothetical protein GmHk_13G039538 [Glycine max]